MILSDSLSQSPAVPNGYRFLDKPREHGRGGGRAILFNDSLKVSFFQSGHTESLEYSEWVVSSGAGHDLRMVIMYRQPYSENHRVPMSVFFRDFSSCRESVILSKEHLAIVGDFNIRVDVPDNPDATKFLDLIDSLGLQQHVDKPTHAHNHTLDLVITRKTSHLIQNLPAIDWFFSDHASASKYTKTDRKSQEGRVQETTISRHGSAS